MVWLKTQSLHHSLLDMVAQAHVEGRKPMIGVDLASGPSITLVSFIDPFSAEGHERSRRRRLDGLQQAVTDDDLKAAAHREAAAHRSARQRFVQLARTLLGPSPSTATLRVGHPDRGEPQ